MNGQLAQVEPNIEVCVICAFSDRKVFQNTVKAAVSVASRKAKQSVFIDYDTINLPTEYLTPRQRIQRELRLRSIAENKFGELWVFGPGCSTFAMEAIKTASKNNVRVYFLRGISTKKRFPLQTYWRWWQKKPAQE